MYIFAYLFKLFLNVLQLGSLDFAGFLPMHYYSDFMLYLTTFHLRYFFVIIPQLPFFITMHYHRNEQFRYIPSFRHV